MKVESKTGPGHSISAAGKACAEANRGQARARVCAKTLIVGIMAGALLSGCAVAMLGGAARSSGSGGSTAAPTAATTSGGAAGRPAATDSSISAAVRSRLSAHATLRAFKIGVDTHDGIVTLRGQVNTLADKSSAQAEARAVKGVKGVNNQLAVR